VCFFRLENQEKAHRNRERDNNSPFFYALFHAPQKRFFHDRRPIEAILAYGMVKRSKRASVAGAAGIVGVVLAMVLSRSFFPTYVSIAAMTGF